MSREIFIGEIKDGQWHWTNREHWLSWLKTRKNGKYVLRPPTSLKDNRGLNQNNLYWKRCHELSDTIGYTPDEIHEWVVTDCGFVKEINLLGRPHICRDSSRDLTKIEFSQLMKKQDEICNEYNAMSEGEENRNWLSLTTTEPV